MSEEYKNPNEYKNGIKVNVLSPYIKEEMRKMPGTSLNQIVKTMLTLEHWITTGDDHVTFDGLNIPYFSDRHPSKLAKKYPAIYDKIYNDLKDLPCVKKLVKDAAMKEEITKERRELEIKKRDAERKSAIEELISCINN